MGVAMDFIGQLKTIENADKFGLPKKHRAIVIPDTATKTLDRIPDGYSVSVSVSVKRDPNKHRRLFKAFSVFVDNSGDGFKVGDEVYFFEANGAGYYSFRQWLKEHLGFTKKTFYTVNGEARCRVEVRSLAVDQCSTKDFDELYDSAMSWMASALGLERYDFESNLFEAL